MRFESLKKLFLIEKNRIKDNSTVSFTDLFNSNVF